MILVSNIGSASRKYAVFDGGVLRYEARAERTGDGCLARFGATETPLSADGYASFLQLVLASCIEQGMRIDGVVVRVVAPGAYFSVHRDVDDAFLARLADAAQSDPIHVPPVLEELTALRSALPGVRVVAASDSAFHATMPPEARTYGIARDLAERHGLYRYGYHGLSVASVARRVEGASRVVVCHLGGGASVTALMDGRSIDTTMGFSPLEGVVMATRSGSLDPMVVLALVRAGMDADEVAHVLYEGSGMKGVSGISPDMRVLLAREEAGDAEAASAIALYAHAVAKAVAGMVAPLGGIDMLVFAGTIGERSAAVRARICARLAGIGVAIDEPANARLADGEGDIGAVGSVRVAVMRAAEDAEMARVAEGAR